MAMCSRTRTLFPAAVRTIKQFGGRPFILSGQGQGHGTLRRGIKTTSTIHPDPVHQDDEKVLEKVLKEREMSEDLPESMMTNPYERPKKICILCKYGIEPNYKNTKLLYQFVSPYTGKVYDKHITGLCKDKQAKVELQIGIASRFAWMSSHVKEAEFLKDPKLCDPDRPVKPHKY